MSSQQPAHPGLFARFAPLTGRDWLRRLPAEDRRIFSQLGRRACHLADNNYHSAGGRARAAMALRQCDGRFMQEPHW